jgi:predicted dinucleotide-binding enzyme
MTTIGFIGAGNIGSNVARAAIANGYDVVLSNSRGPETLADLVAELGPQAKAGTTTEAAAAGDFVVVTIPFSAISTLPVDELAGKIVIDTNNYYWERDGHVAELDDGRETSTGLLQKELPQSKVVKGFNHIGAADIPVAGKPAGDPDRRALATASDHADAVDLITDLYEQFGFDTVNIGPLAESWRVQRDTPAYGHRQIKSELEANLAKATPLGS